MGRFSDDVRKRLSKKRRCSQQEIEFSCSNCLNCFKFSYEDIFLKKTGDIEFIPEPSCPFCSSTIDIFFTDYSHEKIEDMLFKGEIRQEK